MAFLTLIFPVFKLRCLTGPRHGHALEDGPAIGGFHHGGPRYGYAVTSCKFSR